MNVFRMLFVCAGIAAVLEQTQSAVAETSRVDAIFATGIDISDSVSSDQLQAQLDGFAEALTSELVLSSIRSGGTGKVGFAVFLWHHHPLLLVDWVEVGGRSDAERISRAVRSQKAEIITAELWEGGIKYRLTDVSGAIDYGLDLIQQSPFVADHFAINIVGNGEDNYGEKPREATEAVVRLGGTVNAVIIDDGNETLRSYYWNEVVGGDGAFVLVDEGEHTLTQMMEQKFAREILYANNSN